MYHSFWAVTSVCLLTRAEGVAPESLNLIQFVRDLFSCSCYEAAKGGAQMLRYPYRCSTFTLIKHRTVAELKEKGSKQSRFKGFCPNDSQNLILFSTHELKNSCLGTWFTHESVKFPKRFDSSESESWIGLKQEKVSTAQSGVHIEVANEFHTLLTNFMPPF